VLEDGRIFGEGQHEELLRSNSVYREIAASQFSEEDLAKAAPLSIAGGEGE